MATEQLFDFIPPGWKYKTLGAACTEGGGDIQTGPFGSQLHAADYVPIGIPSIMPQNIGDNRFNEHGIARITPEDARRLSRYLVRTGDIVYSRRGDVERRALVRTHENGWLCGTGCLRVRLGDKGANPQFVSQYLGHPRVREWIVRHAHGATMPNLNTSILGACPFLEPPIEEQRAIARILGTLDDKIELNWQMNETLEAMARALFKAWFVDFEPVRAKLEGRWRRGQSLPGLPAHLYDLFPDRLVESELGEIPEGWNVRRVNTILSLAYGKSLPAGHRIYGQVPVYGSGGINGFHNEPLVKGKTVIVGRKGTVGSLYWENRPCFPIDTVFYVQPIMPLPFCYYLLETLPLRDMNTDAAVSGLNRENVYRLEVASPPMELVDVFTEISMSLRDKIHAMQNEIDTLAVMRDILLPKLISGELRIPNLERIIGATI